MSYLSVFNNWKKYLWELVSGHIGEAVCTQGGDDWYDNATEKFHGLKRSVILTKTMTMMIGDNFCEKWRLACTGRGWKAGYDPSSQSGAAIMCQVSYVIYTFYTLMLEMLCLMRYDINPLPISPGDQCVLLVKATSHYAEGQPVGPKHRCGINVEACLACSRVCLHTLPSLKHACSRGRPSVKAWLPMSKLCQDFKQPSNLEKSEGWVTLVWCHSRSL